MEIQSDRRKSSRYYKDNLFAIVKPKRADGKSDKPFEVNLVDFNRFGMAFISNHKFNPNRELLIDLAINKEEDAISGIVGSIRNIKDNVPDNYRYGIEFGSSVNKYMETVNVEEALTNIELILKESFGNLSKTCRDITTANVALTKNALFQISLVFWICSSKVRQDLQDSVHQFEREERIFDTKDRLGFTTIFTCNENELINDLPDD